VADGDGRRPSNFTINLENSMKLDNKKKSFDPHPPGQFRACLVDETPLRKIQTKFGEKEAFRFVFETEAKRPDGTSWCVWSRSLTPSLNEKSNLRKLLRSWLARDVEDGIDTETLLGRPALVVVAHEIRDGVTYANLVAVLPDNAPNPVTPSGSYTRVKDREENSRQEGDTGWMDVVVHVGVNKGSKLGDLKPAQRQALLEKWVPFLNDFASDEDRALRKALEDSCGDQPF
jgi:hypothetical protein